MEDTFCVEAKFSLSALREHTVTIFTNGQLESERLWLMRFPAPKCSSIKFPASATPQRTGMFLEGARSQTDKINATS